MATARQRAEWDRTAQLMAWVARLWVKAKVDPAKLNPYRRDDEASAADLTPAERKAAARRYIDGLMGGSQPRMKAPKPADQPVPKEVTEAIRKLKRQPKDEEES